MSGLQIGRVGVVGFLVRGGADRCVRPVPAVRPGLPRPSAVAWPSSSAGASRGPVPPSQDSGAGWRGTFSLWICSDATPWSWRSWAPRRASSVTAAWPIGPTLLAAANVCLWVVSAVVGETLPIIGTATFGGLVLSVDRRPPLVGSGGVVARLAYPVRRCGIGTETRSSDWVSAPVCIRSPRAEPVDDEHRAA